MNKFLTKTFLTSAIVIVPVIANAGGSYQSPVVDARGNLVMSKSGCVLTKWSGTTDKCAKEVPAAPVVQSEIKPEPKTIQRKYESRSHIVFFNFDSSAISADARNILNKVSENSSRIENSKINIVGHADRAGSDDYNLGLSKRRAASVKNELARMGVASGAIATSAKGESQPLISTQDGVKEPQNRRVEITYTLK